MAALDKLPVCTFCDKEKSPRGRSVPAAMAGGLCDYECPGYLFEPAPDCRWPGEETCGPGCTKGE